MAFFVLQGDLCQVCQSGNGAATPSNPATPNTAIEMAMVTVIFQAWVTLKNHIAQPPPL